MSWDTSCSNVEVRDLLSLQKQDKLMKLPVPLYSTVTRIDYADVEGHKLTSVSFTTGMLDAWGIKYFASVKDAEDFITKAVRNPFLR